MGTGLTTSVTDWSFPLGSKVLEFLKINLKMKTSEVFKDGEPPEDAED